MSVLDRVRRRFARPPEPVRVAVLASPDPDERVLATGLYLFASGRTSGKQPPRVFAYPRPWAPASSCFRSCSLVRWNACMSRACRSALRAWAQRR
mgnify:CR=1 FL=1